MVGIRAEAELKHLRASGLRRSRDLGACQRNLLAAEVLKVLDSHPLQHEHSYLSIGLIDLENCGLLHVVAKHGVVIRQPDFSVLGHDLLLGRFALFVFFGSQSVVVRVFLDVLVELNYKALLT